MPSAVESPSSGDIAHAFVSASNLFLGARTLLRDHLYSGVQMVLPAHTLMGFAVENYLKTYLLKMGIPAGQLRKRPINHDLQQLYGDALGLGLTDLGPDFVALLDILAPRHKDFGFRYLKAGNYTKVHPEPAIAVIQLLHEAVRAAVATELDAYPVE